VNEYQGRPISVHLDTTPMLYVATFRNEYDGSGPMGFGKTEAEAIAHLIEQEEEQ
jgi:hypothetical protein